MVLPILRHPQLAIKLYNLSRISSSPAMVALFMMVNSTLSFQRRNPTGSKPTVHSVVSSTLSMPSVDMIRPTIWPAISLWIAGGKYWRKMPKATTFCCTGLLYSVVESVIMANLLGTEEQSRRHAKTKTIILYI